MARDNNLPAGAAARAHPPVTKTPIIPAVLIGFLAIVILVVNIDQPQIFTVITSIGIVMIYIAYLLVTVPMLRRPPEGLVADDNAGATSRSGRWGLPSTSLAVLWGFGMAINLIWPRKEVYNAVEPFHWYLQWGAVLFIGDRLLRRPRVLPARAAPQDRRPPRARAGRCGRPESPAPPRRARSRDAGAERRTSARGGASHRPRASPCPASPTPPGRARRTAASRRRRAAGSRRQRQVRAPLRRRSRARPPRRRATRSLPRTPASMQRVDRARRVGDEVRQDRVDRRVRQAS